MQEASRVLAKVFHLVQRAWRGLAKDISPMREALRWLASNKSPIQEAFRVFAKYILPMHRKMRAAEEVAAFLGESFIKNAGTQDCIPAIIGFRGKLFRCDVVGYPIADFAGVVSFATVADIFGDDACLHGSIDSFADQRTFSSEMERIFKHHSST